MTVKFCFEGLVPKFGMRESNIRQSLGSGLYLVKAEPKKKYRLPAYKIFYCGQYDCVPRKRKWVNFCPHLRFHAVFME